MTTGNRYKSVDAADDPLDSSLQAWQHETSLFALRSIGDSRVRADYIHQSRRLSEEMLRQVDTGKLSAAEAAATTVELRKAIRRSARLHMSDLAREYSRSVEGPPISLEVLQGRVAYRLFRTQYGRLPLDQQARVNVSIVQRAGVTRLHVNQLARWTHRVALPFTILTAGVTVYRILGAERPGLAVVNEGVLWSSAYLGSGCGATIATSLWTLPAISAVVGLPVAIGVGMFLGGLVTTYAADRLFSLVAESSEQESVDDVRMHLDP